MCRLTGLAQQPDLTLSIGHCLGPRQSTEQPPGYLGWWGRCRSKASWCVRFSNRGNASRATATSHKSVAGIFRSRCSVGAGHGRWNRGLASGGPLTLDGTAEVDGIPHLSHPQRLIGPAPTDNTKRSPGLGGSLIFFITKSLLLLFIRSLSQAPSTPPYLALLIAYTFWA